MGTTMSDSYATKAVQEQVVSAEEHIDTAASKAPASSRLGILLALFALSLLWGGTYLGMRIALQSFPPFILAGVRFLIAGTILYVFLRARGAPSPTRAQWAGSALVGILLLVGGNGGGVFAAEWGPSGLGAPGVAEISLSGALVFWLFRTWPPREQSFAPGTGLNWGV